MLANNLGLPIVPVRIDGLFELKQAGRKVAHPHAVRVKIGEPVRFEPNTDPQAIALALRERVEKL